MISTLRALRLSAGTARLASFGAALFLALVFVLTFQFVPGRFQLAEGDVSSYAIKSPVKVTYVSQIRTREERTRAAAAVSEVYVYDAAIVDTQRQKLAEALRAISDARRPAGGAEVRRDLIAAPYNPPLPPNVVDELV